MKAVYFRLNMTEYVISRSFNGGLKSSLHVTIINDFDLYGSKVHLIYYHNDYSKPYFIAKEVTKAMGYKDLNKPIRNIAKHSKNLRPCTMPIIIDDDIKKVRCIEKPMLYMLAIKNRNSMKFINPLYNTIYPNLDIILGNLTLKSKDLLEK